MRKEFLEILPPPKKKPERVLAGWEAWNRRYRPQDLGLINGGIVEAKKAKVLLDISSLAVSPARLHKARSRTLPRIQSAEVPTHTNTLFLHIVSMRFLVVLALLALLAAAANADCSMSQWRRLEVTKKTPTKT